MKIEIEYEPCKKGRCISYPVCIHKERIQCYKLNHYIIHMKLSLIDHFKYDEVMVKLGKVDDSLWKNIDRILPNLKRVISVQMKHEICLLKRY